MFFALLGPLEVVEDGRTIELSAPKQRAVLALLLLRRGESARVESIAEQLWSGDPPATGVKAVRVYVGELRKSLGADVIVTRAGGYEIPHAGTETDVERFEQLAAEGRQRLEERDVECAAIAFRKALDLWRGPALADFRYEEFAQREITRLEEARMAALESRIDADLALGREDLVPELQALVAEHPLHERLCGQLMLALYRAGRQVDALAVYRAARRRLVEELGIEPSRELQELERAILAHDETIGPPRRRLHLRRLRRRPALLVVLGALPLVAAAAAALATSLATPGGGDISSPVRGDSVAAVDPSTGHVVAEVPVGETPTAIAVAGGAVWVLNADDRTISRIDAESKQVRTFAIGATPTDLAADAGGVWVVHGGKLARAQFAGTTGVALARLDVQTGRPVGKVITLPRSGPARSNVAENHVAVAAGSVWAIAPDYELVRIDPRLDEVRAVVPGIAAVAVAAERGQVWALTDEGKLARIATVANRVTARVPVPTPGLSDLALGVGSVWATDPYEGMLWRIDPGTHAAGRTIDVGVGANGIAYGSGAIWVANGLQGTLTKVDPATNRVVRVIPLGGTPRAVAVGEGLVWVAVAGDPVPAASPRQQGQTVRSLPATMCGPLASGSEPARFVVASDLPLQGGSRFVTPQMSAAVLHVLRAHGFRAGRFPLAYQSCDDSTPRTGLFDDRKCAANTKAYVTNSDVIGVIGPYNSDCAYDEIPIASRAELPVVSPTNTDVGLTRPAFGAPRGTLRALYPTGRRTYVRLGSPADVQAAADALLARRLGGRRALVLDDGGYYGAAFSAYFARAAKRLGLRVVAAVHWDPHRLALRSLAARARRSDAQLVFLCGLIDGGAGEVLAALRHVMPPSTPVIGCDELLPPSLLFEHAGSAARGTYLSIGGVVNERLGRTGRKFLRDFGSTQPGAKVDVDAVYAAQATELLLDAIARSDGTRASVSAELFKARVRDGLIGSFAVDPVGDLSPAPVTIVRLEHGGGADVVGGYEGARVDSVITPPSRLLGKMH